MKMYQNITRGLRVTALSSLQQLSYIALHSWAFNTIHTSTCQLREMGQPKSINISPLIFVFGFKLVANTKILSCQMLKGAICIQGYIQPNHVSDQWTIYNYSYNSRAKHFSKNVSVSTKQHKWRTKHKATYSLLEAQSSVAFQMNSKMVIIASVSFHPGLPWVTWLLNECGNLWKRSIKIISWVLVLNLCSFHLISCNILCTV